MANHHINRVARDLAVEQSLDAALELSEIICKKRQDAPALSVLARSLIGTQPEGGAPSHRELLSNSQLASLSFRAANRPESSHPLPRILTQYWTCLSK